MKKVINYIETTLNGYVIKRIPITNYVKGKDYCGELRFKLDGEDVEYYNDISGDWEELDLFLEDGNNENCIQYQDDNHLQTKENIYLEYYKTDSIGYYSDRYIGISIETKKDGN